MLKEIQNNYIVFDTPQKRRCKDCVYLFEDDFGRWFCDNFSKDIHNVTDDECLNNR